MKYILAFMLTILAVGTSYGQQRQSESQGAKVLNLGTKDKDPAVSDSSDFIQVSGNFVANGTAAGDGGLNLSLWANTYLSSTLGKRTSASNGGIGLRLRGRSGDTASALQIFANQAGDTTTTVADLVGGVTQAGAWTLGMDGTTGHLVYGGMYRIRNSPNMTNGVAANVLDFTGLPAGMYLITGKRTGVSIGTNGLWYIGWSGSAGTVYTTLSTSGLTAPTFSGTNFNVTSNSSTQHYFYAQTLVVDF